MHACNSLRFQLPLALALLWLLPHTAARAAEIELPVALEHQVIHQALSEQLFNGPEGSAELFRDNQNCNSLILTEPRVDADEAGQLRLTTRVTARVGTPVAGRCLLPLSWSGVVETLEQAHVPADSSTVAFRIVDSRILSTDAESATLSGSVWDWMKGHVHPQLGAVTIDFTTAVQDLRGLLLDVLPGDDAARQAVAQTLVLRSATTTADGLVIGFALQPPPLPADWDAAEEAPFTAEELARWDASWQAWDAFATWLIKDLAAPSDPDLRYALAEILLETRYDLRATLAAEELAGEPVRELFLATWSRLAPLLQRSELVAAAGGRSLQLATFVTGANALQALDHAAPHLGMNLDHHTLRRLARMLTPTVTEQELDYDTRVDPELRALLGLDPQFDAQEEPPAPLPLAWLISRAEAASVDRALVKTLTGWIPAAGDLDRYLAAMEQLLDESIAAERKRDKVPAQFFPLYENLVRATAWQESCWRQFVERDGAISPIQSSAGSVGLMQINKHVWRNVYDLEALEENVGYNARAGNEILAHYLVDYAIKRKEHEVRGEVDDLVRATYGVYNGGPSHLSRYRKADTNDYLKGIDAGFWKKYEAIRKHGAEAVKQCY